MDAPTSHDVNGASAQMMSHHRTMSFSQQSQTAQDFIADQLQLEADARETLPYQFDTCTRSLGSIRQSLYSCLTCNPPPSDPDQPYTAAGVCYSCSISCHGEHTLVELFTRRAFTCDCGTSRLPSTSACSLRTNEATGTQGSVHSEEQTATNTYNHNFRNHFCGCGEEYNAHVEKGTMFQCMGLATEAEGGCGEDWWHPECLMGLDRDWFTKQETTKIVQPFPGKLETVKEEPETSDEVQITTTSDEDHPVPAPTIDSSEQLESAPAMNAAVALEDDGHPMPPGFPAEEDFEHFICYKCTAVHPWIKRYASTPGFLPPVTYNPGSSTSPSTLSAAPQLLPSVSTTAAAEPPNISGSSLKRKAKDEYTDESPDSKRAKAEDDAAPAAGATPSNSTSTTCIYNSLPPAPSAPISLFVTPTFRSHFCRCPTHFPLLTPHPYLLEEEEAYEPPLSDADHDSNPDDGHSASSRSLLDRGEAALSNIDRVKAIEGVMAYNRLRDKVKEFLKPFAESGTVVAAEDVKAYFERLRGDDEAIRQARRERGE